MVEVSVASYELFTTIMASNNLTDQHWEAARLAVLGAFRDITKIKRSTVRDLKEVLRFLDYHLRLQGAGQDHGSVIQSAMESVIIMSDELQVDPLTAGYVEDLIRDSPSFANGVRSMMHPHNTFDLRMATTTLITITSDEWFNSPVPAEEMSKFCEYLAVLTVDDSLVGGFLDQCCVIILFKMLRSPEWREHIVPRLRSTFSSCAEFPGERESFWWCLENAIDLLEFVRGSADGEGLKWWYGTLWFHYDKLDAAARDEVERIAKEMSLGDGLSDLKLYLSIIGQEVERTRRKVDELPNASQPAGFGVMVRARLVALEENYHKLAGITGGRQ